MPNNSGMKDMFSDFFEKNDRKHETLHGKRVAAIERKIRAIYSKATEEAAKIGTGIKGLGKKPFSFSDYPEAKAQADKLLEELGQGVETTILNGVSAEWTLANNKNNALSQKVFGDNIGKLTDEQYRRYFNNNGTALEAFIARKTAGLNLSDRVWKYTNGFKDEIEMALDLGIRSGKSADAMSRDLRDYLQHPNKLFRRVRDEHGNLQLSKAAKAFHPSRGVYRSSYMNARRLAVTETNIAYRTADHLRHQQLDFIVGIRIVLSNNHNCKGVPTGLFFDICDELQGNYPKDFKFTGWHPHCRCHVETILKTPEEMQRDTEAILKGEPTKEGSKNAVTKMPKKFDKWVKDHKDKILEAQERGKLPYFLKDNTETYSKILGISVPKPKAVPAAPKPKRKPKPTPTTIIELAKQRHAARTPEEVQRIQEAWDERKRQNILRKAQERHAARTPEEVQHIQKAWDKRKAMHAAIVKEGNELNILLDGISDVDTQKIQNALQRYDLNTVKAEIKKLKKTKEQLEGCSFVPEPIAKAKKFSKEIVLSTEQEMANSFNKWTNYHNYNSVVEAPLFNQEAKYMGELNKLDKLYKPQNKDLAKEILEQKLAKVVEALKFEEYKEKQAKYMQFLALHPNSKNLQAQMDDLQKAMDAHDLKAVQYSFTKLALTKKSLSKKSASSLHGKSPNEGVVIKANNAKTGFINVENFGFTDYPEEATDYVLANNNLKENMYKAFAKTADGKFLKSEEIERLYKCKTMDELHNAIADLKGKYPNKKTEIKKLEAITFNLEEECKMQARAVYNFTWQWDYEIRQVQCGNLGIVSRHGHTLDEIKERAESIERFIETAPKWNGGTTYRGMSMSKKELDDMLERLKKGEYDMKGTSSWSADESISKGFSKNGIGSTSPTFGDEKDTRVVVYTETHKKATPIKHLSEFEEEREVLSSQYERWKFVKMATKAIGTRNYLFIEVEPA